MSIFEVYHAINQKRRVLYLKELLLVLAYCYDVQLNCLISRQVPAPKSKLILLWICKDEVYFTSWRDHSFELNLLLQNLADADSLIFHKFISDEKRRADYFSYY